VRTLGPLIVGVIAGWIAFGELYIPHPSYRWLYELLRDFAQILAATAFILGGLNILQVNAPKIRRRENDWEFKVIMLAGALVMGVVGIQWHEITGERDSGAVEVSPGASPIADSVTISINAANKEALVSVDGKSPVRAWHDGDPSDVWSPAGSTPLGLTLPRGKHEIKVLMPVSGYREFKLNIVDELEVDEASGAVTRTEKDAAYYTVDEIFGAPGGAAPAAITVDTDLVMLWGAGSPQGRVFNWFYDHVFYPCNATMFALLAFFIASAAFRAFRARNVESALLLGAAVLVMIGLVPMGRVISPFFPELADWIVDIPNNAGRRAILMGAALGAIVTGLRVILGLERSHLGSES
jgi:hypothetical protein